MIILFLIIGAVLIIGLGLGATMLLLLRSSPEVTHDQLMQSETDASGLRFHWRYVALPLVILVLTIALVSFFYNLLPSEVVYRSGPDDSSGEAVARGLIILWTLLPQFLLTLFALATAWGTTKLGPAFKQMEGFGISLDTIALAMGNMIALPQAILFFAMLNIFSYNSYEFRVLPLWVIALLVMGLGAIILGIFFIRTIRQVRNRQ
jgi:hypothetical protein